MAEVTAGAIKALREKTGAGMMECKKALIEAEGNEERAIEILRERGLASAKKKEGRVAAEGVVGSYIHMGGKVGVLVEVTAKPIRRTRRRVPATGKRHRDARCRRRTAFCFARRGNTDTLDKNGRLPARKRRMIRRTPASPIR